MISVQKKSQAALEFLTVYGWSITILLLVILGFFYINVFNVQAPNTCNPGSPIICSDVKLDENGDLLLVLNSKLVKTAYIVKYELNAPIKTTCVPTNNIISDMNKEITCNVGTTLIKNQKYSGSATINYILSPSGSQHEVKLEFSGIVESTNFSNENLVNYSDVLVVININSQVSEQVGSYFANARHIPSINIARISVSGNEEINDAEFNSLRSQLESHIINNNLQDKINYIVTTKGVPLKINRGDGCFSTSSSCASVDSELMLILGAYSVYIGQAGRITSPYYYWSTSFSHTTYGIYLVTRLDGYNFEQIRAMIDKSSINPIPIQRSAKFVFDQDPDWNDIIPSLNDYMVSASNILRDRGYTNRLLDTSSVYQTYQNDVIGYISWGSNDHYAHLYTNYAILPIELAYFRGSQLINTNTVRLEWGTISEINNYGFYVQTHAGPITGNYTTFSDIPRSFTPGHGTTNIPQHYSFEYTPQQTGIYSYRLKQIDLDGTVNYIHPIQINFNYNNKIKAVSTS